MEPKVLVLLWIQTLFLRALTLGEEGKEVKPFLLPHPFPNTSEETNSTSSSSSLSFIPPGYKKWELPLHPVRAWRVYSFLSLFIRAVLDIREKEEEIVLDTDFGLQWVDWRIYEHLKKTYGVNNDTHLPHVVLDAASVLKQIWKPDVFIDDLSSADKSWIVSPATSLTFLGGRDGGDIVYTARTQLRLRCDMSFEYYPADTQTCQYVVRSYAYNASEFFLMWNEVEGRSGTYLNDPSDPNFDIQLSLVEPLGAGRMYVEERFDDLRRGNYSALSFTLKARRRLSYHLVQTYAPSSLLIFITWLSFLLPEDLVEARIGISMTTLLTLTAMFGSVREKSPEVSYTMAIDVWMVFCIFFVFSSLLLFTLMYWAKKRKDPNSPGDFPEEEGKRGGLLEIGRKYSFVVVALIFLLFLVTYWVWLLSASGYLDWDPNPTLNGDGDDEEGARNLYTFRRTEVDEYAPQADEGPPTTTTPMPETTMDRE